MTGSVAQNGFDAIAHRYDELWTETPVGIYQREQVREAVRQFFRPGETILDLGCGTGADALWLQSAGMRVFGIDASREMVQVARAKGVQSRRLPLEQLAQLPGFYDGAISNFGVLNCLNDLGDLAFQLHRLIRAGGSLAVCVMGAFCLWETCHFLRSGDLRKGFRRCSRKATKASPGVEIRYWTVNQIAAALKPYFRLLRWKGVGVCVPPSYVAKLSEGTIARANWIDHKLAHWPLLRAVADHRLLVFSRI